MVLIKPKEVEEATKGGILLPDEIKEREQYAQAEGILIATGKNAFCEWNGDFPEINTNILYSKYAGRHVEGKDGNKYRLCKDDDIYAAVEEEVSNE